MGSDDLFRDPDAADKCPQCGLYAFVDGTYGTEDLPGWKYPLDYKLCLNCGYDKYPKEKRKKLLKPK